MYLPPNAVTDQTGYTLFHQAIVDRDTEAWASICTCYQPLLIQWANQSRASMAINESGRDLADQAFARAWAALTPGCFGRFVNLAALLGYLRARFSDQPAWTDIEDEIKSVRSADPEEGDSWP